jgi:hypothetical protein
MSTSVQRRRRVAVATGAVLAAGLIPLTTSAPARADGDDVSPGADTDFLSNTMNFGLFTDTAAADPDDHEFVANVISNPFFTDILTSGADPSDSLGFGTAGIGVAGETVNTFESTMFPFLDSTFTLPFTDPLAELFTALIPFGF